MWKYIDSSPGWRQGGKEMIVNSSGRSRLSPDHCLRDTETGLRGTVRRIFRDGEEELLGLLAWRGEKEGWGGGGDGGGGGEEGGVGVGVGEKVGGGGGEKGGSDAAGALQVLLHLVLQHATKLSDSHLSQHWSLTLKIPHIKLFGAVGVAKSYRLFW